MNYGTHLSRPPRRARSRAVRTAAAISATVAMAVLLAAVAFASTGARPAAHNPNRSPVAVSQQPSPTDSCLSPAQQLKQQQQAPGPNVSHGPATKPQPPADSNLSAEQQLKQRQAPGPNVTDASAAKSQPPGC
jgi:hypothetical protein